MASGAARCAGVWGVLAAARGAQQPARRASVEGGGGRHSTSARCTSLRVTAASLEEAGPSASHLPESGLVCGSRGCIPVEYAVDAAVEQADDSGRSSSWVDHFNLLAQQHHAKTSANCCRCGAEAGKDGEACSLECNCDWATAQAVWARYGDAELASAEHFFTSALQTEPSNPDKLAAYALFCWLGKGNAEKARDLYEKAQGLAPDDIDILASRAYFEMFSAV